MFKEPLNIMLAFSLTSTFPNKMIGSRSCIHTYKEREGKDKDDKNKSIQVRYWTLK